MKLRHRQFRKEFDRMIQNCLIECNATIDQLFGNTEKALPDIIYFMDFGDYYQYSFIHPDDCMGVPEDVNIFMMTKEQAITYYNL